MIGHNIIKEIKMITIIRGTETIIIGLPKPNHKLLNININLLFYLVLIIEMNHFLKVRKK